MSNNSDRRRCRSNMSTNSSRQVDASRSPRSLIGGRAGAAALQRLSAFHNHPEPPSASPISKTNHSSVQFPLQAFLACAHTGLWGVLHRLAIQLDQLAPVRLNPLPSFAKSETNSQNLLLILYPFCGTVIRHLVYSFRSHNIDLTTVARLLCSPGPTPPPALQGPLSDQCIVALLVLLYIRTLEIPSLKFLLPAASSEPSKASLTVNGRSISIPGRRKPVKLPTASSAVPPNQPMFAIPPLPLSQTASLSTAAALQTRQALLEPRDAFSFIPVGGLHADGKSAADARALLHQIAQQQTSMSVKVATGADTFQTWSVASLANMLLQHRVRLRTALQSQVDVRSEFFNRIFDEASIHAIAKLFKVSRSPTPAIVQVLLRQLDISINFVHRAHSPQDIDAAQPHLNFVFNHLPLPNAITSNAVSLVLPKVANIDQALANESKLEYFHSVATRSPVELWARAVSTSLFVLSQEAERLEALIATASIAAPSLRPTVSTSAQLLIKAVMLPRNLVTFQQTIVPAAHACQRILTALMKFSPHPSSVGADCDTCVDLVQLLIMLWFVADTQGANEVHIDQRRTWWNCIAHVFGVDSTVSLRAMFSRATPTELPVIWSMMLRIVQIELQKSQTLASIPQAQVQIQESSNRIQQIVSMVLIGWYHAGTESHPAKSQLLALISFFSGLARLPHMSSVLLDQITKTCVLLFCGVRDGQKSNGTLGHHADVAMFSLLGLALEVTTPPATPADPKNSSKSKSAKPPQVRYRRRSLSALRSCLWYSLNMFKSTDSDSSFNPHTQALSLLFTHAPVQLMIASQDLQDDTEWQSILTSHLSLVNSELSLGLYNPQSGFHTQMHEPVVSRALSMLIWPTLLRTAFASLDVTSIILALPAEPVLPPVRDESNSTAMRRLYKVVDSLSGQSVQSSHVDDSQRLEKQQAVEYQLKVKERTATINQLNDKLKSLVHDELFNAIPAITRVAALMFPYLSIGEQRDILSKIFMTVSSMYHTHREYQNLPASQRILNANYITRAQQSLFLSVTLMLSAIVASSERALPTPITPYQLDSELTAPSKSSWFSWFSFGKSGPKQPKPVDQHVSADVAAFVAQTSATSFLQFPALNPANVPAVILDDESIATVLATLSCVEHCRVEFSAFTALMKLLSARHAESLVERTAFIQMYIGKYWTLAGGKLPATPTGPQDSVAIFRDFFQMGVLHDWMAVLPADLILKLVVPLVVKYSVVEIAGINRRACLLFASSFSHQPKVWLPFVSHFFHNILNLYPRVVVFESLIAAYTSVYAHMPMGSEMQSAELLLYFVHLLHRKLLHLVFSGPTGAQALSPATLNLFLHSLQWVSHRHIADVLVMVQRFIVAAESVKNGAAVRPLVFRIVHEHLSGTFDLTRQDAVLQWYLQVTQRDDVELNRWIPLPDDDPAWAARFESKEPTKASIKSV